MCCNVLQCVAVCCSVLQCVAVCCNVLQCVAMCWHQFRAPQREQQVCCRVVHGGAEWCSVVQCVAMCCNVLQCVAMCCNVMQCVAMCCNVLQFIAMFSLRRTIRQTRHVPEVREPCQTETNTNPKKYPHTTFFYFSIYLKKLCEICQKRCIKTGGLDLLKRKGIQAKNRVVS